MSDTHGYLWVLAADGDWWKWTLGIGTLVLLVALAVIAEVKDL